VDAFEDAHIDAVALNNPAIMNTTVGRMDSSVEQQAVTHRMPERPPPGFTSAEA
jgi:hypothetical protein